MRPGTGWEVGWKGSSSSRERDLPARAVLLQLRGSSLRGSGEEDTAEPRFSSHPAHSGASLLPKFEYVIHALPFYAVLSRALYLQLKTSPRYTSSELERREAQGYAYACCDRGRGRRQCFEQTGNLDSHIGSVELSCARRSGSIQMPGDAENQERWVGLAVNRQTRTGGLLNSDPVSLQLALWARTSPSAWVSYRA